MGKVGDLLRSKLRRQLVNRVTGSDRLVQRRLFHPIRYHLPAICANLDSDGGANRRPMHHLPSNQPSSRIRPVTREIENRVMTWITHHRMICPVVVLLLKSRQVCYIFQLASAERLAQQDSPKVSTWHSYHDCRGLLARRSSINEPL